MHHGRHVSCCTNDRCLRDQFQPAGLQEQSVTVAAACNPYNLPHAELEKNDFFAHAREYPRTLPRGACGGIQRRRAGNSAPELS
jgi:hypothetical protein